MRCWWQEILSKQTGLIHFKHKPKSCKVVPGLSLRAINQGLNWLIWYTVLDYFKRKRKENSVEHKQLSAFSISCPLISYTRQLEISDSLVDLAFTSSVYKNDLLIWIFLLNLTVNTSGSKRPKSRNHQCYTCIRLLFFFFFFFNQKLF